MKSKIRMFGLLAVGMVLLLAACAPAAPAAAAAATASSSGIPVTAPTLAPALASANTTSTGAKSGATASGGEVVYTLNAAGSQASYQVREQLAKFNFPTDAIGTTKAISGSIALKPDGSIDTANSKFTVDLSTLQTDSSMRDGYVRRNILQTSQYPQAVFVPAQVSGLPATIPQSGSVSFKVTGNMTLHGVTKPVTWDVTGTVNNGQATGTATTSFKFEDFGLPQPQVPVVLSVVDNITLNVSLVLQKQ
jgi:polyisoprenoid-binding protein YceI